MHLPGFRASVLLPVSRGNAAAASMDPMAKNDPATARATETVSEVLGRFDADRVVELSPEESAALLDAAVVLSETDTYLSGSIHVLDLDGRVLVQERSQRGEILLREVASVDAAGEFVAARLKAYERMWDG